MKIALACVVFALILPVHAATGGKGKSFTATPSVARASAATGHGNSTRMIKDPRTAPELDPTRKVSEQDCTRPVDLDRGNLRCK